VFAIAMDRNARKELYRNIPPCLQRLAESIASQSRTSWTHIVVALTYSSQLKSRDKLTVP
jgi:hypothetical protein